MENAREKWEGLTDVEKIVWLGENIMKVEVVTEYEDLRRFKEKKEEPRFALYGQQIIFRNFPFESRRWNPLVFINDAIESEIALINNHKEMEIRYTTCLKSSLNITDNILTPETILKLTQLSGQIRSEAMFLTVTQ